MHEFSQPDGIPLGTEASAAEKQSEMGKKSHLAVFVLHRFCISIACYITVKTVNVHNIK